MIVVCAQWQSELMTALQGDFEEELRRMSVVRVFDRPKLPVEDYRARSAAAIRAEDE